MTAAGDGSSEPRTTDALEDALTAARLCAIDPALGGMILRGGGELRDVVVAELCAGLPGSPPVRRVPVHVDDDRLLGGIDLVETLAQGRPARQRGLIAEADGGVIVLPMAERSGALAGRLAAAIDSRESRFVVIGLDDGAGPDERCPAVLGERLAFWIDLADARWPAEGQAAGRPVSRCHPADLVDYPSGIMEAIVATASALGIDSARAMFFALRAAAASALLAGRDAVAEEDVILAVRLVLAPRATRMPDAGDDTSGDAPPPSKEDAGEENRAQPETIEDVVLAAALAALPKDVLARIATGAGRGTTRHHGAGERRASGGRGRPVGSRAGMPGAGRRLSLIDTLRAAAPWQRLRGGRKGDGDTRMRVGREDLRIRRFEARAQALTIFAVDASGSSALARLAEAKGAVELLLAEAYVKRAQVALVAFRGRSAELLLPPTRSLARARRSLAELPGGGATPLAAGINAARELAENARTRGWTPFVVLLTDGRANVAADGEAVRAGAEADAAAAARAIGDAGIAAVFIDIGARPRPEGAALAAAMRARYLPLPRADAVGVHAAVRAAQPW